MEAVTGIPGHAAAPPNGGTTTEGDARPPYGGLTRPIRRPPATIRPNGAVVLPAVLALLLSGAFGQDGGSSAAADSELARLTFRHRIAGLILVEARVEGSEPLVFAIDSGASGVVLERSMAERLKLRMGSERRGGRTSQGGKLTFRVAPAATFAFGDYEVELPNVLAAPCLGMSRTMIGESLYGILGHTFLERHVMEVDYARGEVVLHDPQTYRYDGDGTALPLEFESSFADLPFTHVAVEAPSGERTRVRVLVDSAGSVMGTLGLGTPSTWDAVVPDDAPRVPTLGATGLADTAAETMHTAFVTRLHRVHFGPYAIERPTVGCSSRAGPDIDLFGADALRRFRAVFDYERARLILEPGPDFDEPTRADCSGMMLIASEDDVDVRVVAFVTPDAPAAEAGLEVDDQILEIDGRDASARALHATRELFFEPREFALKVRRGDEVFTTTLRARELL